MDSLTRLYVELTTGCNLNCQMCVRHFWQDIHGTMAIETFRQLIDQVSEMPDPPTLHFGGYGEPMTHPHFLECVKLAKEAGLGVEMTTNGTLLNRVITLALLDLGLDRLVVSIDIDTRTQNESVQDGDRPDLVLENLHELHRLRAQRFGQHGGSQVDLVFIAMRHNIDSLPDLPELARSVGASRVIISNLIPHTPEQESDILYAEALRVPASQTHEPSPEILLPRLDSMDDTVAAASGVLLSRARVSSLGQPLNTHVDICPYARDGYMLVRWDGEVSPCLSLLHDHSEYRQGHRLDISGYTLGNISRQSLGDIWASPDFVDLRNRLRASDFSACPCSAQVDGSALDTEPDSVGCLWALGLVQVP